MTVAQTILSQLGGNRFIAMTGAGSFSSGPDCLAFRLPRCPKNGARACRITLNGNDLYDVRFLKMVKFDVIELPGASDVFCEDLREVFTDFTGLFTSLKG